VRTFVRLNWPTLATLVSVSLAAGCTPRVDLDPSPTGVVPQPPPPAIPEGALLLFSGGVSGAVIVRSGTDDRVTAGRFVGYGFSPDGSRVIATREERLSTGISYDPQLVLIDTTTAERVVIGRTPPREEFGAPIRWSPDGTSIAYRLVRYATDPSERHPATAPGRAEEALTVCTLAIDQPDPRCFPGAGRVFDFDWSPVGRSLALTGPGPRPMQLLDPRTGRIEVFVNLDDPELRAILPPRFGDPVQFTSPRWSPSGRYVAASVNPAAVPVIFDRQGHPVAAGRPALGNAYELAWAPRTDALYYTTGYDALRPEPWTLRSLDPVTGEEEVVARVPPRPSVMSFALSPSGRWLAVADSSSRIRFIDLSGAEPSRSLRWPSFLSLQDWGVDTRI
jgi:dipeptidyl aminopeptidase/acylaminoacyl peptidase